MEDTIAILRSTHVKREPFERWAAVPDGLKPPAGVKGRPTSARIDGGRPVPLPLWRFYGTLNC
jgi:hypothetical protein